MPLKKVKFQDGANVTAECLNNLQQNFDKFIEGHVHDNTEAPYINAKDISVIGYDLNPFNQTLWDHARDYALHSARNPESVSYTQNDRLSESDYVEIGLVDSCDKWTFNGVYWETWVSLSQAYDGNYTVEPMLVYEGSYNQFFQNLNPEASLANLENVIPLNNALLNINLIPTNLSPTGFTLRLYVIGQGTRHQLMPYDEEFGSNRKSVYIDEDLVLPLSGQAGLNKFKIPYRGGFNFLPNKGTLSIPVDIMLNVSATVTANKRELITGDSIQALPFNIGENQFLAFSKAALGNSSTLSLEDQKKFGLLTQEDVAQALSFGLESLNRAQRKNVQFIDEDIRVRTRSFSIIDRFGKDVNEPITSIRSKKDASTHYIVIEETISSGLATYDSKNSSTRRFMLPFADVRIINDNVIDVTIGKGTLVPRSVDDYGNIEYTNVLLSGEYEVLDDDYILIQNATFNGLGYDELYYEPNEDVSVTISEGSLVDLGPMVINFDKHNLMTENLPYSISTYSGDETIVYKANLPQIRQRYPSLEQRYQNLASLIYAKQHRAAGSGCVTLRIRPKYFTIPAGTVVRLDKWAYLSTEENIILLRKDLLDNYLGTQDRFIMRSGVKTNINKAETFKSLNRMSFMKSDPDNHFYTFIKWPLATGEYQTGYAEVFNNSIINYVIDDKLDFTKNKYINRYKQGKRFDGTLKNFIESNGVLRSHLDEDGKRVYYIETLEEPSAAIVEGTSGSYVRLMSLKNAPLNFEPHPYTAEDTVSVFKDINSDSVTTPFNTLLGTLGRVREIEKQTDGTYRIYLYSPSDGWTGNTTHLDKVLSSNLFPSDVVSLNGEPIFLYKSPKLPMVKRSLECISGSSVTNTLETVTDNDYGAIPFSLDLYNEDRAADEINHYLYVGHSLPFNYISFALENALDGNLLRPSPEDQLSYQYLNEAGAWIDLTLLSSTTSSNEYWQYDPNLSATGLQTITFERPSISGTDKWTAQGIGGSEPQFWVRIKFPINNYDLSPDENFETRKDYYPSFRQVVVGSSSPSEIELVHTSPSLHLEFSGSPSFALTITGTTDIDWSMVKNGDFVSWQESGGAWRSATITSVTDGSPTVTINLDECQYDAEGEIAKLRIRKNPLAFVRNQNFEDDLHANIARRTNPHNPILPLSTSGFYNSLAYSIKKQQFILTSTDADAGEIDAQGLRPCFDEYTVSPSGSYEDYHIDKFEVEADFLFYNTIPVVESSIVDDISDVGDQLRINQRRWYNWTASGTDELYFVVARPVNEDRYYLVIFSSNALPAEDNLSSLGLGAFGDKQAYIWNPNYPVLTLGDVSSNAASHASLQFNQLLQTYHDGNIESFGGRDVIGFVFNTQDIFESYDPSRPAFTGIEAILDGTLPPFIDRGATATALGSGGLGLNKLVLPININVFGDIFKNFNEDDASNPFYYSDPCTILTKEYATDETLYKTNLLTYLDNSSSYTFVGDIERNGQDFRILLDDSDRATLLAHAQKVFSGQYTDCSLLVDVGNEQYLDTQIVVGKSVQPIDAALSTYDERSADAARLITSQKFYDLGRVARNVDDFSFETPVQFEVSLNPELSNSLAQLASTSSINLGDGLYCFSIPISNIKHYKPDLEGTLWGLNLKPSDSYLPVDDLFESGVENCYEIASKVGNVAYVPNNEGAVPNDLVGVSPSSGMEDTLLWNFAKIGDTTAIQLCNWSYPYDGAVYNEEHSLLSKFVAVGEIDEDSPDGVPPVNDTARIKSYEKLKEFLEGSSVFLRRYEHRRFTESPDSWQLDDYNDCIEEVFLGVIDRAITLPFSATSLPALRKADYFSSSPDGESLIPSFAEMYLIFRDGDNLWNDAAANSNIIDIRPDNKVISEIIDYYLDSELPQVNLEAGVADDARVLRGRTSWVNFRAAALKRLPSSVKLHGGDTLNLHPSDIKVSQLFSDYTLSNAALKLMRFPVVSHNDANNVKNVIDYQVPGHEIENVDNWPMLMPVAVGYEVGGENVGVMSHHYTYRLVFRKAKSDVYNAINALHDEARSWLSGRHTDFKHWSGDVGPNHRAADGYYMTIRVPSQGSGTANLLVTAEKKGDTFYPINVSLEADNLDAYFSSLLKSIVRNVNSPLDSSQSGTGFITNAAMPDYRIMVGDDEHELDVDGVQEIRRHINVVDPDDIDALLASSDADIQRLTVLRRLDDYNNVIFLRYTRQTEATNSPDGLFGENLVYPGMAIIDDTVKRYHNDGGNTYATNELLYDADGKPRTDAIVGYVKTVEKIGSITGYFSAAGLGPELQDVDTPGTVSLGHFYKITLTNGAQLEPSTAYKTAFFWIPLVSKVPEDYTRHGFSTADYNHGIIYSNNLAFHYDSRKVIAKDNQSLFLRGDIKIEPNVGNALVPFRNRGLDIVKVEQPLPDLNNPRLVREYEGSIIASATYDAYPQDNPELKRYYRLYQVINGLMYDVNVKKYQLVGDGQTFFICLDDARDNNLFQYYDPAEVRLGGGGPNLARITYANVTSFPVREYAYELADAGLYVFPPVTKQYQVYPDTSAPQLELDYKRSARNWAGTVLGKNFYLASRGTKGFTNFNRQFNVYGNEYRDATRFGQHLDNKYSQLSKSELDTHQSPYRSWNGSAFEYGPVEADGTDYALGMWFGDWMVYFNDSVPESPEPYSEATYAMDRVIECDSNHPKFSKFYTPSCCFYAPLAIPLSNNKLGFPHYIYDAETKSTSIRFAYTKAWASPDEMTLDYTQYVDVAESATALPNSYAAHRMPNFITGTKLYVFLNHEVIEQLGQNYEYDYGIFGPEDTSGRGATVRNIFDDIEAAFEGLTDEDEVAAKSAIITQVKRLLSANPIATATASIDAADSSSKGYLVVQLGSGQTDIDFLFNLQKVYGVDVSPYISVAGYHASSDQNWFRFNKLVKDANPPRRDGKPTDLDMVEFNTEFFIRDTDINKDVRKGTLLGGYYVRLLYTGDVDAAIESISGYQVGPPPYLAESSYREYAERWLQYPTSTYLNDEHYWNISIDSKNYKSMSTRKFNPHSVSDWRYGTEDDYIVKGALNAYGPLFDYNEFEEPILRDILTNNPSLSTGDYQWVFLGYLNIEVFSQATDSEALSNLLAARRKTDATTVFSSNDWNKLTRNFDIILDDVHLNETVEDSAVGPRSLFEHLDDNYTFSEGAGFKDLPIYKVKFNTLLGSGRRLTTTPLGASWDYDTESPGNVAGFSPEVTDLSPVGNARQVMPSSSYLRSLVNTESFRYSLKALDDETLVSPAEHSNYYYTVLHTGSEGAYYGFQPNAVVLSKHSDGSELKRGLYYFAVPQMFDYLRLPDWLVQDFDDGIFLEVYTHNGWVRCPVVKEFDKQFIRLPHPRFEVEQRLYPFQDVLYREVLPIIPADAKWCGPSTNELCPPEFGYLHHNTAYYPMVSLFGDDANAGTVTKFEDFFAGLSPSQDNTIQSYFPMWGGVSTLDWTVRPIGGYWFRFVTTIGSDPTDEALESPDVFSPDGAETIGTLEHAKSRNKILRALHTTVPGFVNAVKHDCWIEDVRVEGRTIYVAVAGYKTEKGIRKFKTEVHTINVGA